MVMATGVLVGVEDVIVTLLVAAKVVGVEYIVEVLMLRAEVAGVDGVMGDNVDVQSTVVKSVEVVVVAASAGGALSLTTTYPVFAGKDVVFVMSCVTTTSTVFTGPEPVTSCVAMMVSIDGGSVTAGAVTVTVSSEVCNIVVACGGAALGVEDVAAAPPSTATTE